MNFGGHVAFSSQLSSQVATAVSALNGCGKAEISNLQVEVLVIENVLGLKITMGYSFLVNVVEAFNQLLEIKS